MVFFYFGSKILYILSTITKKKRKFNEERKEESGYKEKKPCKLSVHLNQIIKMRTERTDVYS